MPFLTRPLSHPVLTTVADVHSSYVRAAFCFTAVAARSWCGAIIAVSCCVVLFRIDSFHAASST